MQCVGLLSLTPQPGIPGGSSSTSTCLASYNHASLTLQRQTPFVCSEYRKYFSSSHHSAFISTGSKKGLPLTPFSFRSIRGCVKTHQDRRAELSLPLGPNLAGLQPTGGSCDRLPAPPLPIAGDLGALGGTPGPC